MTRLFSHRVTLLALLALLIAPDTLASEKQATDGSREEAKQATATTYDGPKEDLHVYLLIGQSNMAGRAAITEEISGVIDRCYLLNDKNEWVPAKNPLNLYSNIRKGEGMQKLGPGYGFAKAMLDANPDMKIGLVVNARGGSKIEAWQPKAKYYLGSRDRIKAAMKTGTLKGVLWHQGESNSSNPETYLDQLKDLVGNLRSDLDDKNLPFVAGQIRPDERSQPINAEIAKLPKTMHYTGCALSKGLGTTDGTHFDTKSQIELGQRYAEQMLELLKKQKEADKPSESHER